MVRNLRLSERILNRLVSCLSGYTNYHFDTLVEGNKFACARRCFSRSSFLALQRLSVVLFQSGQQEKYKLLRKSFVDLVSGRDSVDILKGEERFCKALQYLTLPTSLLVHSGCICLACCRMLETDYEEAFPLFEEALKINGSFEKSLCPSAILTGNCILFSFIDLLTLFGSVCHLFFYVQSNAVV